MKIEYRILGRGIILAQKILLLLLEEIFNSKNEHVYPNLEIFGEFIAGMKKNNENLVQYTPHNSKLLIPPMITKLSEYHLYYCIRGGNPEGIEISGNSCLRYVEYQ